MASALSAQDDQETIDDLWSAIVSDVRREYLSEQQAFPWIVGFSGGKDSTVVTHAIFDALMDIAT